MLDGLVSIKCTLVPLFSDFFFLTLYHKWLRGNKFYLKAQFFPFYDVPSSLGTLKKIMLYWNSFLF